MASSGGNRSEVAGVTSVSNPSGRPEAGVTAGYIQFVVGMNETVDVVMHVTAAQTKTVLTLVLMPVQCHEE